MSVASTNVYRDELESDEIRVALGRIIASRRFQACPRLTSFLRFVVEATLAGRGDRIKGYTIGVEAFGRPESFDPQIDPIVRVEATRLRRALAQYYAAEGAGDAIVIDMPRGHYVAAFSRTYRPGAATIWRRACAALQRLLAAEGTWLLPTAPTASLPQVRDGRQIQQAQGAPAARPVRSRTGRDRRDAPYDRGDPRGL